MKLLKLHMYGKEHDYRYDMKLEMCYRYRALGREKPSHYIGKSATSKEVKSLHTRKVI